MNNCRGFTLVEVISTAVIAAVLSGGLLTVMKVSDTTYKKESQMLYLQQQARNGMARMVSMLRESKASTVIAFNEGNDRIIFSTPKVSGMSFAVEDGVLALGGAYGTRTLIASDISRLKFVKDGIRLRIELAAASEQDKGLLTFPLLEVVRLRNE